MSDTAGTDQSIGWKRRGIDWVARLPRPTRADWVFAIRAIVAAWLAYFIALGLQLERPQWAMMTVFIVAQPVAGMVLAKGFYRLVGTAVGAVAGVVLVLTLGSHPVALVVAIALWIGLCAFVSSMLRNPEAYGAALSGYTATIIGLPALGNPHLVVELAQARVMEIMLGIVCAGLLSRFVLPQLAGEAMALRLKNCIVDLAAYASASFANADQDKLDASYHKLIADTQALSEMRAYARLETPGRPRANSVRRSIGNVLWALSAVRMVQRHAVPGNQVLSPIRAELIAILAGIASNPAALDDQKELMHRLNVVAEDVRIARDHAQETADQVQTVARLMIASQLAQAFRDLLRGYGALMSAEPVASHARSQPKLVIHRDFRAAFRNGVRALVATLLFGMIWLGSGHVELEGVVILVAVVTSLFPSVPDPKKAITGFFKGTLLALPIAFVIGQLILPHLPGLGWVFLFTTPVLLLAALAMPNPLYTGAATAFGINFIVFLEPAASMNFAPTQFLIAGGSVLAGILLALGVFMVVFPTSPSARLETIARALRETLLRLSLHERAPGRSAFVSLSYDRINAMLPLYKSVGTPAWATVAGAVASVTVGLEIIRLRRLQRSASQQLAGRIGECLKALARDVFLPQGRPITDAVASLRSTIANLAKEHEPEALEVAASLRIIAAAIGDNASFYRPGAKGAEPEAAIPPA